MPYIYEDDLKGGSQFHSEQADLNEKYADELNTEIAQEAEAETAAVQEGGNYEIPAIKTSEAKKGGPGDYSWGGYEDQRREKITGRDSGEEFVHQAVGMAEGVYSGVKEVPASIIQLPERILRSVSGEDGFKSDAELWTPDPLFFLPDVRPRTVLGNMAEVAGLMIPMSYGVKSAGTAMAPKLASLASKYKAAGVVYKPLQAYFTSTKLDNIHKFRAWGQNINLGFNPLHSSVRKWAVADGVADAIVMYAHEDNLSAQIIEWAPWTSGALGWLATDDADHPLVKNLKAYAEGHLLGSFFGGIFTKFGPDDGGDAARAYMKSNDANINQQAREVVEGSNIASRRPWNAYRDRDAIRPEQGIIRSTDTAASTLDGAKRIDTQWEAYDYGNPGMPLTRGTQRRLATQAGATEVELKRMTKELLGDAQFQAMEKQAKAAGKTFAQLHEHSLRRMQEMMGRQATAQTAEEFWSPFNLDLDRIAGVDTWKYDELLSAELTVNALWKQLRVTSQAADGMLDFTDILSTEGPAQQLAEQLVAGLTGIKRSKYLWGRAGQFQQLTDPAARSKFMKEVSARTELLHQESMDGVMLMMQFLKNTDSDELASGILQVFKQANQIHNITDFDAWMRQKLRGGYFNGATKPGALVRELQGVMVNSILSGPKTPARALIGTTGAAYANSISHFLGALGRVATFTGDVKTLRTEAANLSAMFSIIPDAFRVFGTRMKANWDAPITDIKTRFSDVPSKLDDDWDLYSKWVERNGTVADKAAYNIGNNARILNNNKWATWSTRAMKSVDDTFSWVLTKAESRRKALSQAIDDQTDGLLDEITPDVLRKAEDIEYSKLLDANGNIDLSKNSYLQQQFQEVTLQTPLTGFSKGLEKAFNQAPMLKPFFLFARTGVNGLRMTAKNTPILGALLNESRDILTASAAQVKNGDLIRYGINNVDDLTRAKNLIIGRQALGNSVMLMGYQLYMSDSLTGNGPQDRQMRQMWIDTGWVPRSIKIGGVWMSYESFEPFNMILSSIADTGDNAELMGPEWVENRSSKLALAIGGAASSKSYLQMITQLTDALSGQPGSWGRIQSSILNNQLPFAGLRNEASKLLSPYMRELSSEATDQIRNRNLALESLAGLTGTKQLPIKYDVLNGKPIRNWNPLTRFFNALSPVQFNLEGSPGRRLLWNSNYDLRLSTYTAPNGVSLRDSPSVRSKYQQAIGKLNLEAKLNKLANRPDIKASIAKMEADRKAGRFELDPMKAYVHNKIIKDLFKRARLKAWASLQNDPEVQELITSTRELKVKQKSSLYETQGVARDSRETLPALLHPGR